MNYRMLGRTGVRVSNLCLGALNFGTPTPEEESIDIIHRAVDAGINIIDTANFYNLGESERVVGKALQGHGRENVLIATKFHFPMSDDVNDHGNSRRHIMLAVEDSLRRLGTDWIDLYQIHRPVFDMPQDETLRALDDLVRQGKVRYIGSSTFPAWLVMEGLALSERYGLARYVTEQPPYNLLDRRIENELVPLVQRYEVGLLTWAPLASGVLAGRYSSAADVPADSRAARVGSYVADRITPQGIRVGQRLGKLAAENGLTASQLALLWVKEQPGVTAPIIGSRTLAQLEEMLAVADLTLSPELAAALDALVPPGSAVANFHNNSNWMKMKVCWSDGRQIMDQETDDK
jgi:aryl-alcohol dehydrogenase-like predicted oxidoreductase